MDAFDDYSNVQFNENGLEICAYDKVDEVT